MICLNERESFVESTSHENHYGSDVALIELLALGDDTTIERVQTERQIINTLYFLATHFLLAIDHFCHYQEYHVFDPHVGETSCQLRGYEMLILGIRREELLPSLLEQVPILTELKSKLKKISSQFVDNHYLLKKSILIEDFLKHFGCNVTIKKIAVILGLYLILSSYTKREEGRTVSNYESVGKEVSIGNKQATFLS